MMIAAARMTLPRERANCTCEFSVGRKHSRRKLCCSCAGEVWGRCERKSRRTMASHMDPLAALGSDNPFKQGVTQGGAETKKKVRPVHVPLLSGGMFGRRR